MDKAFAVCIQVGEECYWGYYRLKKCALRPIVERAVIKTMKLRGEWEAVLKRHGKTESESHRVPLVYSIQHVPKAHVDCKGKVNLHIPLDLADYDWEDSLMRIMSPGDLLFVEYSPSDNTSVS